MSLEDDPAELFEGTAEQNEEVVVLRSIYLKDLEGTRPFLLFTPSSTD
jgi:hypothetical protein